MALALSEDLELYRCPICLDLLNDPATIPCGHSYCLGCITDCWNQEEQKLDDLNSCPQCRETFSTRPALNRSVVLAELVDKLKSTQAELNQLPDADQGDVVCDVCSGRKLKAVKSCLMCMASYCEAHIQPHYQSAALKKHTLSEASPKLQDNICPQHNRLLELFCRTDRVCICFMCTTEEHQGHDSVLASKERAEQQKTFEEATELCQEVICRRNEELKSLVNGTKFMKDAAQEVVDHCGQVFTELLHRVEGARAKAMSRIEEKQRAAESEAEGTKKELERELDELKSKEAVLKQLPQQDDVHFLKGLQQIPAEYDTKTYGVKPISFGLIKNSISELKDKIEAVCSDFEEKVSEEESTIVFEMKDVSNFSETVLSPSVLWKNLKWKILVQPHLDGEEKFLGFFLDASSEIEGKSCSVEAILEVINQQDMKNSYCRELTHKFCEKASTLGYNTFMPWDDLMNPEKGYLKDDKVSFFVTFCGK